MSVLLIEIGNTALKAACSEGKLLRKTMRYQGEKIIDYITGLLEKEKPDLLVMASVRDISDEDETCIRALCGNMVLIDRNHTAMLKAYGLPDYLTPDRGAALIAVRNLFKNKNCLVFDFGTTISIDMISADGTYEGGNISPGCRTRFKALNRYSRNLPLVNMPKTVRNTGSSLISSIEAGVISGIMFEIDGYIASKPDSVVIFTGGDANFFAKHTSNSVFIVNNLVLMGLAAIAEDYDR